jgi:hypothetical protein
MTKILNICIGHQPFPPSFEHYYDYMLGPLPLPEVPRFIHLPQTIFGPHGPSLSEYAQIFCVLQNMDKFLRDETHVRTFHYRRFVSNGQTAIGRACSFPWATTIKKEELAFFQQDFSRDEGEELVNTPTRFPGGVLTQYAEVHPFEDILDFAKFLYERGILSKLHVAGFLREDILIPGSSIAVLTVENFKLINSVLVMASEFKDSPSFTPRTGYQRRNMGFLLERLNSFLLLEGIRQGKIQGGIGKHMIISDSFEITGTDDIFDQQ